MPTKNYSFKKSKSIVFEKNTVFKINHFLFLFFSSSFFKRTIHAHDNLKFAGISPRCILINDYSVFLNPISAGVLENQDMLGGGSIRPPPINPMFDVQIWQMIHHWKAPGKNLSKKWKIVHFWKALDHAISNMQKNFAKF